MHLIIYENTVYFQMFSTFWALRLRTEVESP